MEINPVQLNPINMGKVTPVKTESPSNKALESFSSVLNQTIDQVNNLQVEADSAVERFVAGELDIHEVMTATEKANVALQLTIQLRNKVLEAYQEVMRMQI